MMVAPLLTQGIRIGVRYGRPVVRAAAKYAGKRVVKERRKPKPPTREESRGGQHTASSGRPGTARTTRRGPSAQKRIQHKLAMRNKRHAVSRAYRYDPFVDIYDEIYEDMFS